MSNTDSETQALYAAWSSRSDRDALERLLVLKLPFLSFPPRPSSQL